MRRSLALFLLVGSCAPSGGEAGRQAQEETVTQEAVVGAEKELFAPARSCAACHDGMVDEAGADVSIGSFWRSTMMANAARDPYWQAEVQAELLDHPAYAEVIEDKCATCHMPMARFTAVASGGRGQVTEVMRDSDHEAYALAADGVSCTVCHQIEETGLGESTSYSGGFVIDQERPLGERLIYGPYPVNETAVTIMQAASRFIPVESRHIREAALCATCHTLFTPTVDASDEIVGEFQEQVPFLEWLHSDYRSTQSCQDCHMPKAEGAVLVSTVGGEARAPFAKHVFVGGNAYLLGMLIAFREELDVQAASEELEATIERTREQLEKRAASLSFHDVNLSDSHLVAEVAIRSQVGHKLPSAFPARRAWLHFWVADGDGSIVFESGAWDSTGAIVGNDSDVDPRRYEPHYVEIERPEEVQIYESIMQTSEGEVTTALLRGSAYVKDNRLLPAGFDKATASADIMVQGVARNDADFGAGGDNLRYVVDVGTAPRPFTLNVELLYQSVGYRWAQNLRRHEAPEIARFQGHYAATPNRPVVLAGDTAIAGG
jgi:hypothetical protein